MASSSRSARDSDGPPVGGAEATAPPAVGDLITVARVLRPHGLRGEVRASVETDFPERFQALRAAYLVAGGVVTPVELAGSRLVGGGVLLAFRGVEDVEAAGRLRGAELAVRRDDLVPLEEGSYYVFEIIGMRVVSAEGRPLGTVREVLRAPGNDIYVVRGEGGELLLPATREVVQSIDREARQMSVVLLEGMEGRGE